MATAVIDHKQDILEQAAEMQKRITAMQEEIQTLLRGAGGLQVTLPELHDPATGRIDAQKVANYMGVPLARLAEALQLNYNHPQEPFGGGRSAGTQTGEALPGNSPRILPETGDGARVAKYASL